ncbi:MAG: hypothetical protein K2L29_05905 [Duncaniella sp.]|nr:hypothetical protein [Duncaniella sp.]MDE6359116.1 hypothetical protein [Duncaniella sp.]
MSSTLNFRTLYLTLRKDIAYNRRKILIFSVSILSVITITDIIFTVSNAYAGTNTAFEQFGCLILLAAATILPSLSFHELAKKPSASRFLTLPASDIEKFASRWILTVPGSILLLITISLVGDTLSAIIVRLLCDISGDIDSGLLHYCTSADIMTREEKLCYIAVMLALQSFFFLGALLWPRLSWAKTSGCLMDILIVYTIVLLVPVLAISGENATYPAYLNIGLETVTAICFCITPVNYIISFFRLKEAEVINRP